MRSIVWIALVGLALACARAPQETSSVEPEAPAGPRQAGLENGSFHADLDGFRIHYEVHGSGPVMMTVPNSWGLTLDGLRALYRPLEQYLTMVYFDPRGMGGSDPIREDADMSMAAVRADFDALRRHLGQDKVHAIGWSNGASNLIPLAAEQAAHLETAIFLHGTASFTAEDQQRIASDHPDLAKLFGDFMQEMEAAELGGEERDARFKEFVVEGWFVHLLADRGTAQETLRELYRDTGFSWRHNRYAATETADGYDVTDQLPSIPVRSLVIAGAADLLPPERVRELHDGLPNSEFVVFENSGHFSPIEEPQAFLAAVLGLLAIDAEP